jgi:hypothetical protein
VSRVQGFRHHLCDGHSVRLETAEALQAAGVDHAHLPISGPDAEVRPLRARTHEKTGVSSETRREILSMIQVDIWLDYARYKCTHKWNHTQKGSGGLHADVRYSRASAIKFVHGHRFG